MFSTFTYSAKTRMFENLRFKHLSSEYRKLRFKKIRGFQASVFSIFTYTGYSEHRKHGCLKISDFLKSKFSIFTIGEYRKHGFIKVGEKKSLISKKSAFSTWPTQSSEAGAYMSGCFRCVTTKTKLYFMPCSPRNL